MGLSAARSDATTYTLDYLYDERGVVFAGIYASSETTAVPFLMVTTDRGDVRELLDTAGSAFAHHDYDPYGVPSATYSAGTALVASATAALIAARQPLRYASYTLDEASGLYYCSQRNYDPSVAAFISKDPARADGEESAYQYCGGDPVGKVDPSGLYSMDAIDWSSSLADGTLIGWAFERCQVRSSTARLLKVSLLANSASTSAAKLALAAARALKGDLSGLSALYSADPAVANTGFKALWSVAVKWRHETTCWALYFRGRGGVARLGSDWSRWKTTNYPAWSEATIREILTVRGRTQNKKNAVAFAMKVHRFVEH